MLLETALLKMGDTRAIGLGQIDTIKLTHDVHSLVGQAAWDVEA